MEEATAASVSRLGSDPGDNAAGGKVLENWVLILASNCGTMVM
jgi:hypothetical protein